MADRLVHNLVREKSDTSTGSADTVTREERFISKAARREGFKFSSPMARSVSVGLVTSFDRLAKAPPSPLPGGLDGLLDDGARTSEAGAAADAATLDSSQITLVLDDGHDAHATDTEEPAPPKTTIGVRLAHGTVNRLCVSLPGNVLMILVTMAFIIVCAVKSAQQGINIDASVNAFTMPNHVTARAWDGYNAAVTKCQNGVRSTEMQQCPRLACANSTDGSSSSSSSSGGAERYRHRMSTDTNRGRMSTGTNRDNNRGRIRRALKGHWTLTLVFDAGKDQPQGMFTPEALRDAQAVEMGLLCLANSRNQTSYTYRNSLVAQIYLFAGFDVPSRDGTCSGKLSAEEYRRVYTGCSTRADAIDACNSRMASSATIERAMDWAVGTNFTEPAPQFANSQASPKQLGLKGYPYPSEGAVFVFGSSDMVQKPQWGARMLSSTYTFWEPPTDETIGAYVGYLKHASTDNIGVIYASSDVFSYELFEELAHDAWIAFYALLFVIGYTLFHTFSLYITVLAAVCCLSAFPVGYYFYLTLFGRDTLSILTPVTLFIIIGISIDDVYMFVDTYKLFDDRKDMSRVQKMAHTFHEAAVSTLFTTLTSACAFAANTVSSVQALSDFGLFTALVIVSNYIILLLMIPAGLGLWDGYLRCRLPKCTSKCDWIWSRQTKGPMDNLPKFHPARAHANRRVELQQPVKGGEHAAKEAAKAKAKSEKPHSVIGWLLYFAAKHGIVAFKNYVVGGFGLFVLICFWQASLIQPASEAPSIVPPGSNMDRVQGLGEHFKNWDSYSGGQGGSSSSFTNIAPTIPTTSKMTNLTTTATMTLVRTNALALSLASSIRFADLNLTVQGNFKQAVVRFVTSSTNIVKSEVVDVQAKDQHPDKPGRRWQKRRQSAGTTPSAGNNLVIRATVVLSNMVTLAEAENATALAANLLAVGNMSLVLPGGLVFVVQGVETISVAEATTTTTTTENPDTVVLTNGSETTTGTYATTSNLTTTAAVPTATNATNLPATTVATTVPTAAPVTTTNTTTPTTTTTPPTKITTTTVSNSTAATSTLATATIITLPTSTASTAIYATTAITAPNTTTTTTTSTNTTTTATTVTMTTLTTTTATTIMITTLTTTTATTTTSATSTTTTTVTLCPTCTTTITTTQTTTTTTTRMTTTTTITTTTSITITTVTATTATTTTGTTTTVTTLTTTTTSTSTAPSSTIEVAMDGDCNDMDSETRQAMMLAMMQEMIDSSNGALTMEDMEIEDSCGSIVFKIKVRNSVEPAVVEATTQNITSTPIVLNVANITLTAVSVSVSSSIPDTTTTTMTTITNTSTTTTITNTSTTTVTTSTTTTHTTTTATSTTRTTTTTTTIKPGYVAVSALKLTFDNSSWGIRELTAEEREELRFEIARFTVQQSELNITDIVSVLLDGIIDAPHSRTRRASIGATVALKPSVNSVQARLAVQQVSSVLGNGTGFTMTLPSGKSFVLNGAVFEKIIVATTTSTTTTTTTATDTTATSTTVGVLGNDVTSSSNSRVYLVFGLGGDLVDRSRAGTTTMGEDVTKYLPVFDPKFNADPVDNPSHLNTSGYKFGSSVMNSIKDLCYEIISDKVLVLSGQAAVCSNFYNAFRLKSFGLRECDTKPPVQYVALEFVAQFNSVSASADVVQAWEAWQDKITAFTAKHQEISAVIHTSEQYEMAFNEIFAVSGAIWSILISLGLTLCILYIFKGNLIMTVITMAVIIGDVVIVVSCFTWMGWQLGGVEAVALSIIVGTSVDYCLHILEGYTTIIKRKEKEHRAKELATLDKLDAIAGRRASRHVKMHGFAAQKLTKWDWQRARNDAAIETICVTGYACLV